MVFRRLLARSVHPRLLPTPSPVPPPRPGCLRHGRRDTRSASRRDVVRGDEPADSAPHDVRGELIQLGERNRDADVVHRRCAWRAVVRVDTERLRLGRPPPPPRVVVGAVHGAHRDAAAADHRGRADGGGAWLVGGTAARRCWTCKTGSARCPCTFAPRISAGVKGLTRVLAGEGRWRAVFGGFI